MAKQQQKPKNKEESYSQFMNRVSSEAHNDTKRILNNGSKSAIAVNKKVTADARASMKPKKK